MTTINTDQDYQNRVQHFTALKSKYQATQHQDSSPSSPLYFILRKADLGIELTDLESIYLQKSQLSTTFKLIQQEQQHRSKERINLGVEFTKLKSKYKTESYNTSWTSSDLYFILCKIESGDFLTEKEFTWLLSHGFKATTSIAIERQKFISLKSKYQATQYQDLSPSSPLYPILKKIDSSERLNETEYKWLLDKQLSETLGFVKQQEATRREYFSQLKEKYQATKYQSKSLSSPLYTILKKLDAEENLIDPEINWLKEQELIETISIADEKEKTREFVALKIKYQATEYEDLSPKSHLYKVLKNIDLGNVLAEQDVNFLKKRKLVETIKLANDKYLNHLKYKNESLTDLEIEWLKNNDREDIIILVQERLFSSLKLKYAVFDDEYKSPSSPLYSILQKLEQGDRIEPKDVGWLQENNLFYNRIWTKYHCIEADFYKQEFKRTGDKWNLVNASSHLRKADQSELALQLTNNLPLNNIKDNKFKSALFTTRGGAFRDIDKLGDAEICARQAMKFQPDSHHPYTLMGAICYQQGKYLEGDNWFREAIKRGANPRDTDSEIKSVLKKTKNEKQCQELVNYLLKKDLYRYAWAKNYLKK
ncbi:hypothetical protein H6G56_02515 [Anabaena variabilis FACHB-164]|uniref:Uncharacterized protein n=1 Tax=Trichormus variabilis SAG 1403-4b TaxID=447716 RepID=A0A433V0T0_ANAVA|nr:hypothetical protein [Trichormus variabilis]MBD2625341.1 hypothetical protein [Trichormus variabilis FACHB-164]RUS99714.1 hypothetical protein DSM107003_02980 [Trichormus variabilis SAG 1403-4b]